MSKEKPQTDHEPYNEEEHDVFIAAKIFPDPVAVFQAEYKSLGEIKNECLFVIDTNALLIPFTTGAKSLETIKNTYLELVKNKRLIIPAHVAREFAKLRATKLSELYDAISKKQQGTQSISLGFYPLLESNDDYKKADELQKEANKKIQEFRDSLGNVLEKMRAWIWNDPVSLIYKELFDSTVVIDPSIDEEKTKEKAKHQKKHKLPPGYKDSTKEVNSAGDLIIWETILNIAENKKQHLVFVSGEEKPDWWHKSSGKPLYPRYELIDEYRRVSEGKSFHIISFADFLKLFGASNEVVEEVRITEADSGNNINESKLYIRRKYKIVKDFLQNQFRVRVTITPNAFHDFVLRNDIGQVVAAKLFERNTVPHKFEIENISFEFSDKYPDFERLVFIFITENEAHGIIIAKFLIQEFGDKSQNAFIVANLDHDEFSPILLPNNIFNLRFRI